MYFITVLAIQVLHYLRPCTQVRDMIMEKRFYVTDATIPFRLKHDLLARQRIKKYPSRVVP